MTILSIAALWLVVGLVAAMLFGTAIHRTGRLRDEYETPRRAGASIQYIRRGKIKPASHAPLKGQSGKHHRAAG